MSEFFKDLNDMSKILEQTLRELEGKYREKKPETDSVDRLLQSFETIPREATVSKEKAAIADTKELVQYLEKMVDGTLQEIDRQKIRQKKEEYGKSIELLTEMLLESHKD